ncbi:serine--tRNA ligase [Patescibacteria group bacterium]|nr:serine--tRNA ligase [Patescibacteria group bacterium]
MLDIKFIRENKEKVKKGVVAKQLDPKLVDKVLELDGKRLDLLQEIEELRAKRNKLAKDKDIEGGRKLKKELQTKEPALKKIGEKYQEALFQIPNLPADDVPVGKDESENKVLRKVGKPEKLSFKARDHLELGEALDIIDVKRAAKVSGTRFGYLKGDAVLLEFALVNFALETLIKEGFTPLVTPVLIKKDAMRAMGYLEHGGEEDMYVFEKDGLVLVGTSEQAIGPMHMNEIFELKDLPKKYVGFSACFRREAGTYGKDTRGIMRLHQFDKVEMFSFVKPQDSDKEHKYLLSLQEKLFKALEIPYQVVEMCTGDLGAPAARKYDLEAWMPGQGKYREVTSASNATDFQARRLNIKYQDKGKTGYVHTLNGTAFAIGRTIIAILENYQQKDGSVEIPKVLQKWIGKEKII